MFVAIPRCMMKTLQWSRPETNVSSQTTCRYTVTFATAVCCAGVLFQPSFSLSRSTRCLWNTRHPTRWLWYGLGNGARCVSRNVTLHRLSAHSWDSLTPHLSTAVCINRAKECSHVIHDLSLSHPAVSATFARTTRCSYWDLTSRRNAT